MSKTNLGQAYAQAKAEGKLTPQAKTLEPREYQLVAKRVEGKLSKNGHPQVSILWQDGDQSAWENITFSLANEENVRISAAKLVELGMPPEELGNYSLPDDISALGVRLGQIVDGYVYTTKVTVKTSKDGQYTNNSFRIKDRHSIGPSVAQAPYPGTLTPPRPTVPPVRPKI